MKNLTVLIKPASSACNMRCSYCFYHEEAKNREVANYGIMRLEYLELLVQQALSYAEDQCTFAFQGGEPTLAGLPFFESLIVFETKYNRRGIKIHHIIQTNGLNLNADWCAFLFKHNFLVGLSLDGFDSAHNRYRKLPDGSPTFHQVINCADLLTQYRIPFNVLCVVTAQTAKEICSIYHFFKRQGYNYQQYIPCISPYTSADLAPFALDAQAYGAFLVELFDLWYEDMMHNQEIYIPYFEHLVNMLMGYLPSVCGMAGCCQLNYVVESNGNVYPCDFYALDDYCIGNILSDDFAHIDRNRQKIGFISVSQPIDVACMKCEWKMLCRGGCRRYRDIGTGKLECSALCAGYKRFFAHSYTRLSRMAKQLIH